eukprot:RCo014031
MSLLSGFVLAALLGVFFSSPTTVSLRRKVTPSGQVYVYDQVSKAWVQDGEDPQMPSLAIAGRRFNPPPLHSFRVSGLSIIARPAERWEARAPEDRSHGDTGRTTWDAAVVLAMHLDHTNGR